MIGAAACWTALAVVVAGFLAGAAPADPPAGDADRRVLVTTVDQPITPVIANHLDDGVDRAESGAYDAFVVRLDTPGGLDSSMRAIIQRCLAAEVPVVVYVSPDGARAASAGALITFAAHVAAMAPGTAIGASTPVDLEGGDVERKIVNDAAALAESIARVRDRDVDFAVDTVREGRSASAAQAVELGAVDLLARSLPDLLDEIDGRSVEVAPDARTVTLTTEGAEIDEHDLGLFRSIQQLLADPNLAFLFLSIGTLAILYELASPGIGAGGAAGAVLLLLAMFSLAVLPVNAVGLLLLAVAVILFAVELYAPGVGVAAVGGTAALVFSGVFLFEDAPGLEVSLAVVVPIALVVGVAVIGAGRLVVRAQNRASTTTGTGLLVGREITVEHPSDRRAQTFVEGAWWSVRSTGPPLRDGAPARVVHVDGLDLVVEPATADPSDNQQGDVS